MVKHYNDKATDVIRSVVEYLDLDKEQPSLDEAFREYCENINEIINTYKSEHQLSTAVFMNINLIKQSNDDILNCISQDVILKREDNNTIDTDRLLILASLERLIRFRTIEANDEDEYQLYTDIYDTTLDFYINVLEQY